MQSRTVQFISAVTTLFWAFLQIQACTLDFENEKLDRQNVQHQLHVILKELRKARSQIIQLESLVSLEWFNLKFIFFFFFLPPFHLLIYTNQFPN